jgi:phosphatidylserine decarboxylase
MIKLFMHHYQIKLNEYSRKSINEYKSFNDFFTRELSLNNRPIDESAKTIISPVDGTVADLGSIKLGKLIQVKGIDYRLDEFLNHQEYLIKIFENGFFISIYLAPYNYHRVHLPFEGTLVDSEMVPGKTHRVDEKALRTIENLYIENQRLIRHFESNIFNFSLIMVAALNVSSMSITPKNGGSKFYEKAEEYGRFNLGSTVVLLFPESIKLDWSTSITTGQKIKFGECIAKVR